MEPGYDGGVDTSTARSGAATVGDGGGNRKPHTIKSKPQTLNPKP
jgi:hypothetical protein